MCNANYLPGSRVWVEQTCNLGAWQGSGFHCNHNQTSRITVMFDIWDWTPCHIFRHHNHVSFVSWVIAILSVYDWLVVWCLMTGVINMRDTCLQTYVMYHVHNIRPMQGIRNSWSLLTLETSLSTWWTSGFFCHLLLGSEALKLLSDFQTLQSCVDGLKLLLNFGKLLLVHFLYVLWSFTIIRCCYSGLKVLLLLL